jgi:hypothetical protein
LLLGSKKIDAFYEAGIFVEALICCGFLSPNGLRKKQRNKDEQGQNGSSHNGLHISCKPVFRNPSGCTLIRFLFRYYYVIKIFLLHYLPVIPEDRAPGGALALNRRTFANSATYPGPYLKAYIGDSMEGLNRARDAEWRRGAPSFRGKI